MMIPQFALASPYSLDVQSMGAYHLMPLGYQMVNPQEISPVGSSIVVAINMSTKDLQSYRDNNYAGKLLTVKTNRKKDSIDRKDFESLRQHLKNVPGMTIDYQATETTGSCLRIREAKELYKLTHGIEPTYECKDGHIGTHNGGIVKMVYKDDRIVGLYEYGIVKASTIQSNEVKHHYDTQGTTTRLAVRIRSMDSLFSGGAGEMLASLRSLGYPIVHTPTNKKLKVWYISNGFTPTGTNQLVWTPNETPSTPIKPTRTVVYTNNPHPIKPRI